MAPALAQSLLISSPGSAHSLLCCPHHQMGTRAPESHPHISSSQPRRKRAGVKEGFFSSLAFLLSDRKIFLIILQLFTFSHWPELGPIAHPWVNYYEQDQISMIDLSQAWFIPWSWGHFPLNKKQKSISKREGQWLKSRQPTVATRHLWATYCRVSDPLCPSLERSLQRRGESRGEAGKKLKKYNKGDFKGQSGNEGKLAP